MDFGVSCVFSSKWFYCYSFRLLLVDFFVERGRGGRGDLGFGLELNV